MELMTQAQYARHRGVSRQAIGKLKKAGKIPVRKDGRIDPAEADHALGETQERINVPDEPAAGGYVERESSALTKAKTATEAYRAKVAQLDFEQRIGRLVAIEDVTRSMARCAELIVRELDQLPSRSDDLCAAFTAGGSKAVRVLLREIGRTIRSAVSQNMRIVAADEADRVDELV